MTESAFSADIRMLLCPRCGAPITTPAAGGELKCAYCGTVSVIRARDDAYSTSPLSPDQEGVRIQRLWELLSRGPAADPYSMGAVMSDLAHLERTAAPRFDAAWQEAWNRTVALLQASPSMDNQRRVYWLAALTQSSLPAGDWEPRKKRAVAETALDLLPDPGYRQMCRQMLCAYAIKEPNLAAAERWLAGCDPAPAYVSLDSDYRITLAMLLASRGDWQGVVTALGRRPGDLPLDPPVRPLCDCYRAHALDAVGEKAEAKAQFTALLQDMPQAVRPIMARHAHVSLCEKLAARTPGGAANASPNANPVPPASELGLSPDFIKAMGTAESARRTNLWVSIGIGAITVAVIVSAVVHNVSCAARKPGAHSAPHPPHH